MKRFFDLAIALTGLVLMFPTLTVIGLLVLIFDGLPVIFKQKRIGKNGKPFLLYKFRTMKYRPETNGNGFQPGNTSNVTKLGRILRKTKLDEIPQLLNVIKDDMSIVGPRPEVKKWVEVYPERWAIVHSMKPGITDNASIEFTNEEKILSQSGNPEETYKNIILPRKIDLYIEYVNDQSLNEDIRIILRTIKTLLISKNI